jgi:hypothetical protein
VETGDERRRHGQRDEDVGRGVRLQRPLPSATVWYDASGTTGDRGDPNMPAMWSRALDLSSSDCIGPVCIQTPAQGASFASNYPNTAWWDGWKVEVPTAWRAALGGWKALTGNGTMSIVGRQSYGVSLMGFNLTHPMNEADRTAADPAEWASTMWNGTTLICGAIWPADSDTIIFMGRQGLGSVTYSGTYIPADGFRTQLWLVDANDLADVFAGTKQPYEVFPYEIVPVTMLDHNGEGGRGFTYNPSSRTMFFRAQTEEQSYAHTWTISADEDAQQIIPKALWAANYVDAVQYVGVNDGRGQLNWSDTNGASSARIPMPFAGTFRKVALYSRAPWASDISLTLRKNNVDTAQTITLPSGQDGPLISGAADVSVAELDDISYKFSGPGLLPSPGYYAGTSIEFEGPGNVFGIAPDTGSKSIGTGWIGGAFGNGFFQAYTGPDPDSTSYSICAVNGTITRLALKAYNGAPGTGVFTGWLQVNGVIQDGTGGTVNTTTTFTGTATSALGSFSLPVTVGQHVDVVVLRTGAAMGFTTAAVGAGIGFVPTVDGEFMCCGGSNDTFSNSADAWKWTRSNQGVPIEQNLVTSCSSGFTVRGLYVETGVPGAGKSIVCTILKNEVATAATVTVSDLASSGLITGLTISFSSSDTMTLLRTPVNNPAASSLYWGLAATLSTSEPPESEVPGGGGGGGEGSGPPAPLTSSFLRTFECIHGSYTRTVPLSGSYGRTAPDSQGST